MLITHSAGRLFYSAIMVGLILLIAGCEKDNPVSQEDTYRQANLLPVSPGRLWVYTAYSLDTTARQKIPASVHREATYAVRATTFAGKSCFLMIDSVYTSGGAVAGIDTSYLAVENGDLLQWNQDYGFWLAILKRSAGLNTQYTAGQYQGTMNGASVSVTFNGIVTPPESITAPIGTVQAYKTEITVQAALGGTPFGSQVADFYFADGYGPVRKYIPVQLEMGSSRKIQGEESLLVSKNF
jgi:hypothetical protein